LPVVHLSTLWEENLQMMKSAPPQMQVQLDADTQRLIERLVFFVDGAIESETDVVSHPLAEEFRNWAPWNLRHLAAKSQGL